MSMTVKELKELLARLPDLPDDLGLPLGDGEDLDSCMFKYDRATVEVAINDLAEEIKERINDFTERLVQGKTTSAAEKRRANIAKHISEIADKITYMVNSAPYKDKLDENDLDDIQELRSKLDILTGKTKTETVLRPKPVQIPRKKAESEPVEEPKPVKDITGQIDHVADLVGGLVDVVEYEDDLDNINVALVELGELKRKYAKAKINGDK